MKKNELKNGMIVQSSGGRYGVVCIKDATDSNCIKFFYDPMLLVDHGSVEKACYGSFIVSLDEFNEDLVCTINKEQAKEAGISIAEYDDYGDEIPIWNIRRVFSLKEEWVRQEEYFNA